MFAAEVLENEELMLFWRTNSHKCRGVHTGLNHAYTRRNLMVSKQSYGPVIYSAQLSVRFNEKNQDFWRLYFVMGLTSKDWLEYNTMTTQYRTY